MCERILVVDDERDAADTLAMLIRTLGHEAQAVYDGQEAIAAAASFLPDMALIDIGMPGMTGFETVARIRENRGTSYIVLVAVTGWTRPEDKQHAYECGFDLHVAKPMDVQKLRELLAILSPGEVAEA